MPFELPESIVSDQARADQVLRIVEMLPVLVEIVFQVKLTELKKIREVW